MSILVRLLRQLTAWALPRPLFILGLALVSVAASVWLTTTRLQISTSQLELISTRHPLIALSDKLDPFNFHGKATFAVVVRAPSQERAIEFMKALVERIHAAPEYFLDVFYRIDPEKVKKWVLYYLDKKDLAQIRDNIEEHSELVRKMAMNPDLLNLFRLVNQEMASRMVGEFFTGFLDEESSKPGRDDEPMDLDFLIRVLDGLSSHLSGNPHFISPWSALFENGVWDLEIEGYLWEGRKKFLIAAVMPRPIKDGVSKTQKSLTRLRQYIGDLKSASFGDVDVGVTGQEAMNNDEMATALADMTKATWLSLLGVALLMVWMLNGFRHPLIITITLVVGLCWTFGWTTIFIGHLNILSVVFAPMLCGLGVDYGIHWFARFEEERDREGGDRSSLTRRVMETSGPGILVAGLSTAFSFLPFILTGFRGLMELGMITGMGILLTLLATFTVLPALTHFIAAERRMLKKIPNGAGREKYLLKLNPRGVWAVLGSTLALSCLAAFGASSVQFDLNPLRLQSRNAESVMWEKILIEASEHSIISAAVITHSAEEAKAQTAKLKTLPSVADVDNVFTLLPEDQEEKEPLLRSILAVLPDLEESAHGVAGSSARASPGPTADIGGSASYGRELIDVLMRIRFKMQEDQADKWGASKPLVAQMVRVKQDIDNILQLIQGLPYPSERLSEYRRRFKQDIMDKWALLKESSSAPPMRVADLPPELRDQFLQGNEYLLRIYPKGDIWEAGSLARFVNDVRTVNPEVVGDPVSLYVFSSAYRNASIAASIYSLIAISLLLAFTFRSFQLMLLSLIPLFVGTVWTVGIMGATGFDFNLANSIFMPLVVGAGVEYGVIILHRWREGTVGYGKLPFSTAKGVILAALTTTLGFGALMIANHQGIFSLGFVACVGSVCVLVSALFVLPAILSFVKAPSPASYKEM